MTTPVHGSPRAGLAHPNPAGHTIPAYSEVMEDHRALTEALAPCADRAVLCVASAGDNVFHLQRAGAARVVAVDIDPAQIALARWKWAAILDLDQGDLLRLAGLLPATEAQRLGLLVALSPPELESWPALSQRVAERGLLGCGKLPEFLEPLRAGLTAIVGRATLETLLLDGDPAARRTAWDALESPAAVNFLAAALNQATISDAFIPAAAWPRMAEPRFHLHYLRVLRHLTLELDPTSNVYLHRLWLADTDGRSIPAYLEREYRTELARRPDTTEWVCADLLDALEAQPAGSIDRFNLSNVLDWCEDDHHDAIWAAVERAARPGAACFLRSFLVARPPPAAVLARWKLDGTRSKRAAHDDRVGYFSRYELWRRG